MTSNNTVEVIQLLKYNKISDGTRISLDLYVYGASLAEKCLLQLIKFLSHFQVVATGCEY